MPHRVALLAAGLVLVLGFVGFVRASDVQVQASDVQVQEEPTPIKAPPLECDPSDGEMFVSIYPDPNQAPSSPEDALRQFLATHYPNSKEVKEDRFVYEDRGASAVDAELQKDEVPKVSALLERLEETEDGERWSITQFRACSGLAAGDGEGS